MKKFLKENKINIFKMILQIIIILLEVIAILLLLFKREIVNAKEEWKESVEVKNTEMNKIKVEMKGAVNNPSVYEVEEGSRVIDVVNIAGGFTPNANTTLINLSKKVEDEMVIIIYTNEDIEAYQNSHPKIEYVYLEKECVCPDPIINQSCIKEDEVYATEVSLKQESNDSNLQNEKDNKKDNKVENDYSLVNINKATKEELMKLDGIGESKANLIIEYRSNSPFQKVEDLQNVKGIGNSIYEKIKDKITI